MVVFGGDTVRCGTWSDFEPTWSRFGPTWSRLGPKGDAAGRGRSLCCAAWRWQSSARSRSSLDGRAGRPRHAQAARAGGRAGPLRAAGRSRWTRSSTCSGATHAPPGVTAHAPGLRLAAAPGAGAGPAAPRAGHRAGDGRARVRAAGARRAPSTPQRFEQAVDDRAPPARSRSRRSGPPALSADELTDAVGAAGRGARRSGAARRTPSWATPTPAVAERARLEELRGGAGGPGRRRPRARPARHRGRGAPRAGPAARAPARGYGIRASFPARASRWTVWRSTRLAEPRRAQRVLAEPVMRGRLAGGKTRRQLWHPQRVAGRERQHREAPAGAGPAPGTRRSCET